MTLAFDRTRIYGLVFAMLLGAPALADESGGNSSRGQRLFLQCAACHSLQPAPGNVGPALAGIVGRKAAATP